jgi:hypothetical protein
MAAVVFSLVKYTARDTIAVLRALLELALSGKLRGVAICYRDTEGNEEVALTGIYRNNSAYAVNAGVRLKTDGARTADFDRTWH